MGYTNSALKSVGAVGQYSYKNKSEGRIETNKKSSTIAKKNNSSSNNLNSSKPKITTKYLRDRSKNSDLVTTNPILQSKIDLANSMAKKSGGWYSNLDYALGGYMPWSLSPTIVKTDKANIQTIQNAPYMASLGRLNDSNHLLNEQEQAFKLREAESEARYKSTLDLFETSWWENLGFGRSPQEQIVQKAIQTETFGEIAPNLTDDAINRIMNPIEAPTITEGISSGFKWGIPLMIGIGAFMLLKK